MNVFLAVFWKDVLSEWRGRDRFVAMLVFALLVLVVFHFSLPGGVTRESRELAPGLLWIAYVFASILGLNRAFSVELENDALTGLALAPRDRGFVFLGKAAASFLILGVVQIATAAVFAVVFEVGRAPDILPFGLVVALGSIGLCAVGTLLGAVAVRTRFREIMLPLLMLPLLAPVLSGSVRATSELLLNGQLPFEPIQLLIVADAVYLIVAFVGFEYVLDE